MGRRGPKPQPTILKLARGNPGQRALNENEPQFAPASLEADPERLSGLGLTEWHRQLPELVAKGVLTVCDISQFRQYCWMYGEVASLEDALEKKKQWNLARRKLSAHLALLHQRLTQQAAHFGITPSTRSGITAVPVAPPKKGSDIDEYFGATA